MHFCSGDAPRSGERNVNLNKNSLENVASNEMFHPHERAPSFIFKQMLYISHIGYKHVIISCFCNLL